MEYKYVIGGSNADFYLASYSDVIGKDPNVIYLPNRLSTSNGIVKWMYDHHFSPNLNRIAPLPFKSIWNRCYLEHPFDRDDKICFVLFSGYMELMSCGLAQHLRKRYPNCKIVFFFQDMISKVQKMPKGVDPKTFNQLYDLVLSFDQKDCDDYGFTYYPLVYSKVEVADDPDLPQSDVYFVGKVKNRWKDILDAYCKLRDAGLTCDFHIVGLPESEQVYPDEIHYRSYVPYEENLRRIKKTKCMLEVMQQGGQGYTLRYGEAIALGKRMLTNNTQISGAPFYSPEYVSVFDTVESIQPEFVKNGPREVDYHFVEKLSPMELLRFIDRYFAG